MDQMILCPFIVLPILPALKVVIMSLSMSIRKDKLHLIWPCIQIRIHWTTVLKVQIWYWNVKSQMMDLWS